MTAPATVELQLHSAPESVALVRAGLKGFGTLLEFEAELLEDLQMVASEACNNVVRHAYDEDSGPLEFRVTATNASIEVVVRDYGEWIEAEPADDDQPALGLALIEALADETQLNQPPEGGTEVCMRFARDIPALEEQANDPAALEQRVDDPAVAPQSRSMTLSGDVIATVSPVSLLPGVLGRLSRALAAQARFSVERFSDIHLVVDSLVGHAQRWASNGRITFALRSETRRLVFRLGPLRKSASELTGISCGEGLRPRLDRLVDELEFEPRSDAGVLSLTFTERGLAHAI